MKIVKPQLVRALPKVKGNSLSIIGGAGRVTQSLLARLHHTRPNVPVSIYVSSQKTQVKLEAFLADLGMCDAKVTGDLKTATDSEIVVFCAGASTQSLKGPGTKESLFAANKEIAQNLLSSDMGCEAIVAVTNPTTGLTPFIERITAKPVYGVGVENDNIRYQRSVGKSKGCFLVGAHNFFEIVEGSVSAINENPVMFDEAEYKRITKTQDALLSNNDMGGIIDHVLSLRPEFRWYAVQRMHSKFNVSTSSCAEAITNVADLLSGKSAKPVTVETSFSFDDGSSACMGWPITPETNAPAAIYFTDGQLQQLDLIKRKYSLLKKNA